MLWFFQTCSWHYEPFTILISIFLLFFDIFHETFETTEITETFWPKPKRPKNMDDFIDTEPPKRIIDLVTFQQPFKTNPPGIYEEICEVSKRMEKTENVSETFRDENYELTLANETQNIII